MYNKYIKIFKGGIYMIKKVKISKTSKRGRVVSVPILFLDALGGDVITHFNVEYQKDKLILYPLRIETKNKKENKNEKIGTN